MSYNPELGTVYGAYLLLTLGCTFYVLRKWFERQDGWVKRAALPLALLIMGGLFWYQNWYRGKKSPEAVAMHMFERVLVRWEFDKAAMIQELNYLATSERPWEATNPYEDPGW